MNKASEITPISLRDNIPMLNSFTDTVILNLMTSQSFLTGVTLQKILEKVNLISSLSTGSYFY